MHFGQVPFIFAFTWVQGLSLTDYVRKQRFARTFYGATKLQRYRVRVLRKNAGIQMSSVLS